MVSDEMQLGPAPGDIIEQVIAKGDLAKLSPAERTRYYVEVCRSVGLNPLTQPFAYITLNGKLQLYALRGCTDQLRTLRGVSVEDITETEREGVYIVTCKVRDRDGRSDIAQGAVSIAGLKGEALANAVMKAETKAKRRATLSIAGLGWLDESEVDSISDAVPFESGAAYLSTGQLEALQLMLKQLPEGDEERLCAKLRIRALSELPAQKFTFAESLLQQKIQSIAKAKSR